MKLKEFATKSKYLKWDREHHFIALAISFDEFCELEPVLSDAYGSDQFEIPIFVFEDQSLKESHDCILGTKSKVILNHFIEKWEKDQDRILRVKKIGSGFNTKYEVIQTDYRYSNGAAEKISKKRKK